MTKRRLLLLLILLLGSNLSFGQSIDKNSIEKMDLKGKTKQIINHIH